MVINTELIDDKILSLLNYNEGDVISYEEYRRDLKELIVKNAFNQKFSEAFLAFLSEERKKIIGNKGNFIIRSKKTKVIRKGKRLPKEKISNLLLPSSKNLNIKPEEENKPQRGKNTILGIVISIRKSVDEIYKTLKENQSIVSSTLERTRIRQEQKNRAAREDDLESKLEKTANFVSKIFTPIQGILGKIFRFIFFTILGQALGALFKWLKDPENKKKFNSLIRFLTEHWKFFVGAFLLFGTSFGSFVRGMLKAVAKGLIALAVNIPKIKRFLQRNPKLAMLGLGAATYGTGLIANTLNPPGSQKEGSELENVGKTDFDKAKKDAEKTSGFDVPVLKLGGLLPQEKNNTKVSLPKQKFIQPKISLNSKGSDLKKSRDNMNIIDGIVGNRGIPFTGGGKDNKLFPTATGGFVGLSGKEFIVNEGAVTKETLPLLMALNRMGAGESANKAKLINSNNVKISGNYRGGTTNIGGFNYGGSISNSLTPKIIQSNNKSKSSPSNKLRAGGGFIGGLINAGKNLIKNVMPSGISVGRSASATQTSIPMSTKLSTKILEHRKPQVQALLKTIKTAEHYRSTKDPYNVIYGGGTAPITKMTVKEVIDMYETKRLPKRLGGTPVNYGSGSGAAGAYQFMPFTLEELIKKNKVKPNQIMVPDLQDKLAWDLVKNRGVKLEHLEKGLTNYTLDKLSPEWASLPTLSGNSFYGQPVKSADTLKKVFDLSLKKMIEPPPPPSAKNNSTVSLPPIEINKAKKLASSISNKGDDDMVADIFKQDSSKKLSLLNLS